MKNYLADLQEEFADEIEMYGITAIMADHEDVMIPRKTAIPNKLYDRIEAAVKAVQLEENSFTDEETKGCDQDHAERDNEL